MESFASRHLDQERKFMLYASTEQWFVGNGGADREGDTGSGAHLSSRSGCSGMSRGGNMAL